VGKKGGKKIIIQLAEPIDIYEVENGIIEMLILKFVSTADY